MEYIAAALHAPMDGSQMMLSSDSLGLFPLLLLLFSFMIETKIRHVISGNTNLRYPSCSFFNDNADFDIAIREGDQHIDRVVLTTPLH